MKWIVIMKENRKWRCGNDGKLKGNFAEMGIQKINRMYRGKNKCVTKLKKMEWIIYASKIKRINLQKMTGKYYGWLMNNLKRC
jgi:hypothetical protein